MHMLMRIMGVGTLLLGTLGASALPGHAAVPAASTPRCHSGRLYIAPVPNSGQGAMGHVSLVFSVKSLAQHACYLYGFPGMQMVDARGHDISTHVQWGGGYAYTNQPKQYITLKTGQVAYFNLIWVHFPTPGQSCPTASYLLVTPPDETTTIAVPVTLQQVCGGKLTTSPIISTPGS